MTSPLHYKFFSCLPLVVLNIWDDTAPPPKQHQKQNYFYPKTLTTGNNSQLNTSLNKHRPSQPEMSPKQRINIKNKNNKITLLSTITFFRNQHYFKQRTKTDLLAFANLLYTITAHILYLINVIILQNKSTMFSSTTPLTNDSQFSHGSLNLSAHVIATNKKYN